MGETEKKRKKEEKGKRKRSLKYQKTFQIKDDQMKEERERKYWNYKRGI